MNKEIFHKLVEQHGGVLRDEDGNVMSYGLVGKQLEQFADSIIRECAEFVGWQRNDIPACGFEFELAIKDHYEVANSQSL